VGGLARSFRCLRQLVLAGTEGPSPIAQLANPGAEHLVADRAELEGADIALDGVLGLLQLGHGGNDLIVMLPFGDGCLLGLGSHGLINLDTTLVNVALPSLTRELGATTSQLQWVVDAYNLVFAALLLTSGSLSDRFGRKGMLLAGLAVFGGASFVGGYAGSADQLVAARAVMGLGAAMTFPSTLSMLTGVFTARKERALAIGLWGATAGVAIALGPIVGGALLAHYSWSSIFYVLGPVSLAVIVLVARFIPSTAGPSTHRLDPVGLILSAAFMGLLVYTVIEAPSRDWVSAPSVAGYAVSAVLLVAFVAGEAAGSTRCSTCGCSGT
jgi:MFS family permease